MRFEPSRYQAPVAVSNGSPASFSSCLSAVRTIKVAMAGLTALEQSLQAEMRVAFDRAVQAMLDATGRMIVTGMGKSGHIGAKIAATLASTRTPAFFVHPAEASHGDLGMITPNDVVLALSWSGVTSEQKDIVVY